MKSIELRIKGMHCESCARSIELALEEEGIIVNVDFNSKKAKIAYDEERINIGEIIKIIKEEGYRALQ